MTGWISVLDRKMRFSRTESGKKKRAPKHSVTKPERKSRNMNFWDRRRPMPDAETPGNFRKTIESFLETLPYSRDSVLTVSTPLSSFPAAPRLA